MKERYRFAWTFGELRVGLGEAAELLARRKLPLGVGTLYIRMLGNLMGVLWDLTVAACTVDAETPRDGEEPWQDRPARVEPLAMHEGTKKGLLGEVFGFVGPVAPTGAKHCVLMTANEGRECLTVAPYCTFG